MSQAYLRTVAIIVTVGGMAYATPIEQRTGPVEKGQGTLGAARKYLEGLWVLVSYEIFQPGQSPLRLQGEGTLVYDDFGNLEMTIQVDGDTALVLEKVGIDTSDGILSTKGRTVIDLQARTLVFVLDGQPAFGLPSGPLALNRTRHWEVDGDMLTLTTKGEDGQPLSISRWQKKL